MTHKWKVCLSCDRIEKVIAHRWDITRYGDLIFFANRADSNPFQAYAAGTWLEIKMWE